ncbi:hypothetical protein THRCLA_00509 [Thraustotheca clavata]|uniref:Zinc finger PHD-type domain-containing protein n=1 Tax=Thraustotheca clavata TaxID=74557 RepID=A0A1W0AAX7_9STRA|nr:hypothetical protein THRCLA_00509 [Thraustotheca clavata]
MSLKRSRSVAVDECPKCQFSLFDNAGNCKVCDFILSKQKLRPCIHCDKTNCQVFCDMCGQGYHKRCADKCGIAMEIDEDHVSLVCKSCENDENDWNVGCGECTEAFANEEIGLQVGQLVLVEFEFVLYNAIVMEVNEKKDSVKIHFVRWSKTFDGWYKMDDERVNESLACDGCNQWFHIGCLPAIKSTGRYKHTSYVCAKCYRDAKQNRKPKLNDKPEPIRQPKPVIDLDVDAELLDDPELLLPELPKRKVGRPSLKQLKQERETLALRKAMLKSIKEKKLKLQQMQQETRKPASTPASPESDTRKSNRKNDDIESDSRKRSSKEQSSPSHTPSPTREKNDSADDTKKSKKSAEKSSKSHEETSKKVKTPPKSKDDKSKPRDEKNKSKEEKSKTKEDKSKSNSSKSDTKRALDGEKVMPRKRSRSDDRGTAPPDTFRPIAPKPKPIVEVSSDSDLEDDEEEGRNTLPRRKSNAKKNVVVEPEDEDDCLSNPSPDDVSKTCVKKGKNSLILLSALLNSPPFDKDVLSTSPPPLVTMKKLPSLASVTQDENNPRNVNPSAFDILRVVASQTMNQSPCKSTLIAPPVPENSHEFDMHYCLREEMYVQVCAMEEAGLLTRDFATILRQWTHPSSSRFEDVRFVYLVNKHNSPALLAQRLAEVARNYG